MDVYNKDKSIQGETMKFPHAAARITSRQITSTAVAQALDSGGNIQTNRVLLKASAASVYVGGATVSTTNGAELPNGAAAPYLELWVADPAEIFVVGTGTVYVVFEEPSAPQIA